MQKIKKFEDEVTSCILSGHKSFVNSICFSSDSKYIVSGSYDKNIKIWESKNGRLIRTLNGHESYVLSVCFSKSGKYIVSGSYDNSIKIWESKNGRLIRTLNGHEDSVRSVCISSNGKYIASGSSDTTVIIWSAESGERLSTLWTWDHDDWLTITPDRYYDGNTRGIEHLGFMDNNCIYPANEFAQWYHKPEMIKKALTLV